MANETLIGEEITELLDQIVMLPEPIFKTVRFEHNGNEKIILNVPYQLQLFEEHFMTSDIEVRIDFLKDYMISSRRGKIDFNNYANKVV